MPTLSRKPKPSKTSPPASPLWLERAMGPHALLNIFTHFLNLPSCLVTDPGGPQEKWHQLSMSRERVTISNFEALVRKTHLRSRYNQRNFAELKKLKKPLQARFHGYDDLYVPLHSPHSSSVEGLLTVGPFLAEVPDLEHLQVSFQELTGRKAAGDLPEFLEYCRLAVSTPVLDQGLQGVLLQVMQGLADYFMGQLSAQELLARFEHLQVKELGPRLPYRAWQWVEIKRHKLFWGHTFQSLLMPWDKAELGLSRHPRLVLALALQDPQRSARDEASALLRDAAFQRECFRLAKEFPDSIAGRLDSSGAFILTSFDVAPGSTQEKLRLRDLALNLRSRLQAHFQEPVTAGVGGAGHGEEELPSAFREAVTALHLCQQLGRAQVFFDEQPSSGDNSQAERLQGALAALKEACSRARDDEMRLAADHYASEVVLQSGERADAMRVHLSYALFELLEPVRRRGLLPAHEQKELSRSWEKRLDAAATSFELMALFRELIGSLTALVASPSQGGRALRLAQAKAYIDAQLSGPLSLEAVARQAGFSASRFSRLFKKAAGNGFGQYVLQARLEQARLLLRSSRLPIHQVAQEAGFSSSSYFIQAFKRSFAVTPQAFRRSG